MEAISRRNASTIHKSFHSKHLVSANHEAIHEEAFHSEHSTSSNHTAEEETQPEDSSTIQEKKPTSKAREAQQESGVHH